MKKQVTFAEGQSVHRLHQDETFGRSSGVNEPKLAVVVNFNSGLKVHRPPATRCKPQLQHETDIQIPKTRTAAPFLKHSALSPAQREYLYTIAASYSTTHVRDLITQHYMNVLHRCLPAGCKPERDDLVVTSVNLPVTQSGKLHTEKINTSARNPGKSFLPKIPNRQARLSNTSASKQTKIKKRTTASPTLRRKSPRRVRIRLEEEEKRLDDSLSECLSSPSMGEWDDDTFSDL